MKNIIILLIAISTISLISKSYGQNTLIQVLDQANNQALPYANVCTENLSNGEKNYQATNTRGKATLKVDGKSILSISFIGYETRFDTIYPDDKNITYRLIPSVFSTQEVVVTGQHKPVPVDKSVYRIKLIDSQSIERKSAVNMAELLKNELNISVNHDPATGSGLKLQGISGQNVKILIDGVPVIGRLDGNIDMSQIDLSNVDHIEIVEGPMSVIYGSNALAGVINIITKENKYAKIKASLNTYYESVGIYNANAGASFKKNKSTFSLSAGRNFFSGYDTDKNDRSTEYKPKEQYNSGLKYGYNTGKLKINLNTSFFKESLLDRSNINSTPYSIKAYDTWFCTMRSTSGLRINQKLNENSSFQFIGAYAYYNRSKQRYLKDMISLDSELSPETSDHDTTSFDAITAQGVYNRSNAKENLSIQAGFDINYEHGTGKRMQRESEEIADYAVFSGMQWTPLKNTTFQPGLRIAHNTKYKAPLVPSLNLRYAPGNYNIRASYARGFRAPSLKELYLFFYDSNHQIEGNEELEAEYSHNFNASADYLLNKTKHRVLFSAKAFFNDIENMITLVQVDPENDLHYRNQNIGTFMSAGGEFSIKYNYSNRLNIEAGFSRIGRSDFDDADTFIYYNNFSSSAYFSFWKNTAHASLNYKLTGKYPFYTDYDGLTVNYLDNYHMLDVSVSKSVFSRQVNISIGVKNLFNNTVIGGNTGTSGAHGSSTGISSLAGWGRTFFAGIKYEFSKY